MLKIREEIGRELIKEWLLQGKINISVLGEAWRKQTKGEVVKSLSLDEEKGTVDYALPQDWVDNVKNITGFYPTNCFVWFYPHEGPYKIFGIPYPLTDEARMILKILNRYGNTNYPIF